MRNTFHVLFTVMFLWSVVICVKRLRDKDLSHEDRLIKRLLKNYKHRGKYGRPVKSYNDTVGVKFGIQLIQILDLDEKNQVLTLNVWDHIMWTDVYLKWTPIEHGNVTSIRIPPEKLWTPDIKLYNYADLRLDEHRDALCVINYTGEILWMPQAVYKSSCEVDVKAFPFDIQNCTLKFGSWTYNGQQLELKLLDETNEINLLDYIPSPAWAILEHPARRNVHKYDCCAEPFYDVTFNLVFQRKAIVYNYILILPCVLLTSLTLVLFWIPPESPAKMQLGMNVFVAFFVLMLLLEENLPPASKSIPLLGGYYCLNMSLITLSSFLNVIVVNLAVYGSRTSSSVPRTLKMIMFRGVARVLCMASVVAPYLGDSGISTPANGIAFRGVTENKWTNEWSDSGDILYQKLQEQHAETSDAKLMQIHQTIKGISEFLKNYRDRLAEKDRKDKVAREWKALALVFDRIFFFLYLITIITSLTLVMYMIM